MTEKNSKKSKMLLIAVSGLLAVFTIVGWLSKGQADSGNANTAFASSSQTQVHEVEDRFASLNRKARLAKGGDERAVKDLADEVFGQFSSPEVNDALSLFKDRLVNSEVNYLREGKEGISERKLVNSLNKLTRQLGTPDFARVSVAQVRYLRINLLTVYPNFIGQLAEKQLGKSTLKSDMSPLEAAAITMLLVTQKLSNPDFQVPPQEWAVKQHEKRVAEWEAHRNGDAQLKTPTHKSRVAQENAKSEQLLKAFSDQSYEALSLVDDLLTDLGISSKGRTK